MLILSPHAFHSAEANFVIAWLRLEWSRRTVTRSHVDSHTPLQRSHAAEEGEEGEEEDEKDDEEEREEEEGSASSSASPGTLGGSA